MDGKKSMRIRTAYVADLTAQVMLDSDNWIAQLKRIDQKLMEHTNTTCLDALKYCVSVFLAEWEMLKELPSVPKPGISSKKREADLLIHSTKDCAARYPDFDRKFPYMPAYTRRTIIADVLGIPVKP